MSRQPTAGRGMREDRALGAPGKPQRVGGGFFFGGGRGFVSFSLLQQLLGSLLELGVAPGWDVLCPQAVCGGM